MCGVRNGRFNLHVSVGFRSGNKISYVEIDSKKWRLDTVDDLEACIRVLRNAFVVFHTERDTFLASVFAGWLNVLKLPFVKAAASWPQTYFIDVPRQSPAHTEPVD